MKKLILQLVILCCFAFGFRGSCYYEPYVADDPLFTLIYGFRYNYNSSSAGLVENYFLAAGDNGKIYRSVDPLTNQWNESFSGTANRINYLKDSETYDTTLTYGVGDNGTIVRSEDQGLNWSVLNSTVTTKLNGIEFINYSYSRLVIVGDSGLILMTTNSGNNWTSVNSGVTKNLNSVFSLNNFNNFIAGDDGTFLRSTDGGASWENRSFADTTVDLNKIGKMGTWFFGTILGMVGDNGTLYSSTNYLSWNPVSTGTTEDLYELKFKNGNSGYVAGDNGTVRYTTNGGNEWFSDFFIGSLTDERISSTLIVNDTVSVGLAGNEIITLHANESLLPVELTAFSFSVQNNNVNLSWTTSSELNNSGFDIERSDVINQIPDVWNKVGFVNGNGTVSTPNNYEFTDNSLNSGRYIYRLKQIDFNGNFEYFNLSGEVVIGVPDKFYLSQNYPNPFNPSTKINYELKIKNYVSLKVFDMSGKEVKVLVNKIQDAGSHEIIFNASDLSSGTYFYRLETNGFVQTKKMLLLK